MFAVLGVPGVDVDLAAGRQGAVPLAEPAEEAGGVFDLLGGEAADAWRDVAPVRSGPEPGKDVPGREEPDRLGVAGVGDAGQVPGKPALEGADVLVGRWQHSAGYQELFQVSCCPPGLELMSAQQFALEAAACAVEGLREPGAGGADRGAVAGPEPWKGTVLAASGAGARCAHRAV